jgi:AraC-like DNA-binding protein
MSDSFDLFDKKEAPFFKYLTYSKEDERLGMLCTDAGYVEVPPNIHYPPNKNDHPVPYQQVALGRTLQEFQLVYITEGGGIFESQDNVYTASSGSVLLILPGIKHKYRPKLETGWKEYWVGFKGGFFNNMLDKNLLNPDHVFFELGANNNFLSTFRLIFEEVTFQKPLYQIKTCAAILSLIAELLVHERRKNLSNHSQQIVEKAKYLMETFLYSDIAISEIAGKLGVSVSKLNEIFKQYSAMTPHQYFIHIKINVAKTLLEQKDCSFSSAIFAHKCVYFPSLQVEMYVIQRLYPRKCF